MSLRTLAEADLSFVVEDSVNGFGWLITVTDPNGVSAEMVGLSNDVSQIIDPDTGQAISGRSGSICLRLSSIALAGLGVPRGIVDNDTKPWVIRFNDINGLPYVFKVMQSNPDRALGVVTCILEVYKA